MVKKKILITFGTRPEAIKLAPLIIKLKQHKNFLVKVCITSQHKKMLKQVLNLFKIKYEYDLKIMKDNQTLGHVTSKILNKFDLVLNKFKPDLVIVHGDTTTTMASSISAYYKKIDVAHVEAGLRTENIYSPFPEEINRKITSNICKFNFAPTNLSKKNLINENIKKKNILVTGNTVVDSLLLIKKIIKENKKIQNKLVKKFGYFLSKKKKIILVTGHRRENFGKGFRNICMALLQIIKKHQDVLIIYPVHLNPNVKKPVKKILKNNPRIILLDPLNYVEFVFLMSKSYLILTDSGGIQEEAPTFNKPVLIMRNHTERPEAVKAGSAKLVGTNQSKIYKEVSKILLNRNSLKKIQKIKNPFGNGNASLKIVKYLNKKLF